MNSPDSTPDVTAPENPTPARESKASFLRMFAASLISMLLASIAAGIAVFVIIAIAVGSSGNDIDDIFNGLVVALAISWLVGMALLVLVSTVTGRALVRVFTEVTLKYWQVAVALVPVSIVVSIVTAAISSAADSPVGVLVQILGFVVAPSVSALILMKFAENESV